MLKSLDNSNGVQYYGGNDPAKMGGRIKKGQNIGGGGGGTAKRSNVSIIRGVIRMADSGSTRAQQALERYSRNSGAESTYGSRVYGGSDSAFLVRNSRSRMRESALNTPARERSSIEKSIARNERKRG